MYDVSEKAQYDPRLMQGQGGGGIVGRPSDQCAEPTSKRPPEMVVALGTLDDRLSQLEKEQEVLASRLSCILRSEPAQCNTTSVPAPPTFSGCTPVTSAIASATNRVNSLIFRTRTMLDLLEL